MLEVQIILELKIITVQDDETREGFWEVIVLKMNMIRKILLTIISIIIVFTQATFAQEVFRVTSVNFDTSNSLIFLTSPDKTTESIMKNVKLIRLQNPKRAYFDINSAVLTSAPQEWFLNSGGVKHVKVSQFSTNPSKIRVVLYLKEDFDFSKISFLKVNNNIVIKFKDFTSKGDDGTKSQYFQNTYREEHNSSSDFYENLSISSEDIEKVKSAVNTQAGMSSAAGTDVVFNQIQQAFNAPVQPKPVVKAVSSKTPDGIKKELKLKSKYYLDSVNIKPNGFLVSGFGVVGIEKPMYLTNPARVVFDIPNSRVNSDLYNKEFKINEKESVRVSQYSANTARIVVTTAELEKYFPIFSSDDQSVLITKVEPQDITQLFSKTTDAVAYYPKQVNSLTDEFVIAFNAPVVHSIKRDKFKLTMDFYNALRYNDQTFRHSVKTTPLEDMKIDLLPKVGLKLTLPLEKDDVVKCYMGADGKSIKFVIKHVRPRKMVCSTETAATLPRCKGRKAVVLDAGHGGSDYGAIRSGINEKDINLDVTKRVQAILTSKGVSVGMARDTDEFVSLENRTIFTANKSPDIFVSIHVNSSAKPEITGIETHYYHQESLELAQTVHSSLASYIKSKDRGLFKSKFYVINHTEVPAILVEIGFISNENERSELVGEARKQQTAKAIAEGILRYLNK